MARAYLDSCILIYLLQGPPGLAAAIQDVLRPEAGEAVSLCISDLVRLECWVGPLKLGDKDLLHQFDDLFRSRDLESLPLHAEVFDLAAELRAHHGTKTPDAIHLTAAILGECEEFWTNDLRLQAPAAQGKIRLRVIP
jgi:predicted nucleic acid-binding protein